MVVFITIIYFILPKHYIIITVQILPNYMYF